jgi:hypothetical protein
MSEIKEHPILFNGEMVRAVLDGRKTQTRRVVKSPEGFHLSLGPDLNPIYRNGGVEFYQRQGDYTEEIVVKCPYGQPGERLWVRETWAQVTGQSRDEKHEPEDQWEIRMRPWIYRADWDRNPAFDMTGAWKPSIHMPRAASRILLEVVDIRVEAVQAISESDAWSEGIGERGKPLAAMVGLGMAGITANLGELISESPHLYQLGDHYNDPDNVPICDHEKLTWTNGIGVFAYLWDAINFKRGYGWRANPWVWVVEFKIIEVKGGQS